MVEMGDYFYHIMYTLKVNLNTVISWVLGNLLLEAGTLSELEPTTILLVNEHSTI